MSEKKRDGEWATDFYAENNQSMNNIALVSLTMNIYYSYKCNNMNTMCRYTPTSASIVVRPNEWKGWRKSLVASNTPVEAIQAFNFGALISFCSIPIVFFPFLLFANYIEQLFGASLDLGETPLFFFSFLASEKKYTEVSYMIQMVIFVVVPNSLQSNSMETKAQ